MFIFEDMHAEKMGKFNLWLFCFESKVKFKWYQNASLSRVHNILKGKLFHMPSRSLLSIFAKHFLFFESIIYCIRFCFESFTIESFFVVVWDEKCYATSNRFMWVDIWEHPQDKLYVFLWKCEKSMSEFLSSL